MRISDTKDLCDFISAHAAESWSHPSRCVSKVFQAPDGTVQHTLHILAQCVLQTVQDQAFCVNSVLTGEKS